MIDRPNQAESDCTEILAQDRGTGVQTAISRRAVLRGATATVPSILTLTSGAALARSSNLIGTIQTTQGDVLCLETASTEGPTIGNPNVYDLGSPAYGEVTRMPSAYRYQDKSTGTEISPAEVCRLDGTVQIDRDGSGYVVEKLRAPGVMVSNTAVASFGTRIITTDI